MINFAFFGTDEFATTILEELKASDLVPGLIVTTPDTPEGRHSKPTPSAVKLWAEENGIKYIQPQSLRSDLGASLRSDLGRWDLFIVASYGKIIPQTILDLPKHGTLNIHPSLLPQYRGATPLQSAILNGDTETGVSIMLLDAEMDHGPILAASSFQLSAVSFIQLRDKLAKMGAELLAQILPDYLSGKLKPVEQDHKAATYTQKITKDLGLLNLNDSPEINDRKIHALNPNPGTYFIDDNGKRVKILSAHLSITEVGLPESGSPTSVSLVIDRVIPEGKKEMDWESYQRGLTK